PKIVILDEPVSAIDADLCDQVLMLLASLKEKFGLSYIFISHDPDVINRVCDRVLVLENGEVRERKKE
ncbi:MAG: ABC transporter ATP-binding protein, partial [Lachnospiraceae bacterium]|nr:ABC transporter ATP-binding protein [Lachnospiraceae bacterium]